MIYIIHKSKCTISRNIFLSFRDGFHYTISLKNNLFTSRGDDSIYSDG